MGILVKDSLYYLFMEIQKLHFFRTQTLLDEIDIYPGQPPMLFILDKEEGQSQKELADRLKVKPSTITVMLKRMEKSNLVRREQDPKDQRISRVYLTEAGKEKCNQSREVIRKIEKEIFGKFTSEEAVILRRLFMQMKDNLIDKQDVEYPDRMGGINE